MHNLGSLRDVDFDRFGQRFLNQFNRFIEKNDSFINRTPQVNLNEGVASLRICLLYLLTVICYSNFSLFTSCVCSPYYVYGVHCVLN